MIMEPERNVDIVFLLFDTDSSNRRIQKFLIHPLRMLEDLLCKRFQPQPTLYDSKIYSGFLCGE